MAILTGLAYHQPEGIDEAVPAEEAGPRQATTGALPGQWWATSWDDE